MITTPGLLSAVEAFNGEGRVALPVGKTCFQLAPPVIADVSDDERLQAVNARLSPDLGIVTESHRSGAIALDYAVTNVRRGRASRGFVRGADGLHIRERFRRRIRNEIGVTR